MRFHKAELAFFVMLGMVAVSAYLTFSVYENLGADNAAYATLNALTVIVGLLGATVLFGIVIIYPMMRKEFNSANKLRTMTENLSARSQSLEHAALTDGLTGMQNRRYFDDALNEYLAEFARIKKPLGMMILDLDHFKNVNDTYGHDVGDEVLRRVAQCLQEFTRYHDIVARLGGEEFVVVAPNLNQENITRLADRIRVAISGLTIKAGKVTIKVTVSIGIAIWDGNEASDDFYRRADKMLYSAKRDGRNRVCA